MVHDAAASGYRRESGTYAKARPSYHPELVDRAVDAYGAGVVAVIGHGGVGTLWYCHLTGAPIDRRHDQPGQGHYYEVDLTKGAVVHPWRPIDEP